MTINVSSAAEAEAYAKKDLAARLAIPVDDVRVLESAETVWPDASLGMPEPGMMYAQMLTEGFRVVLGAGGEKYEYHFGGGTVKSRRTTR
jgi:hypothetical protein